MQLPAARLGEGEPLKGRADCASMSELINNNFFAQLRAPERFPLERSRSGARADRSAK